MKQLIMALPDYYEAIVERLIRADWLVHNFPLQEASEIYNPANYLYNIRFNNKQYFALLDLNVFQYIIKCPQKDKMNDLLRDACAMLVFCKIAEIEIEPALAIYERVNYNSENLEKALYELSLLRALDNTDADELARYAVLGDKAAFKNIAPIDIDRNETKKQLTRYKRLTDWDSIYLLVLMAVDTYFNKIIPQNKKLEYYINQMLIEFRKSFPCIVYAIRLFGKNPLKKMMKFKMDDDEKNECFRKYASAEESYSDHSFFLTSRARYATLFELFLWLQGYFASQLS